MNQETVAQLVLALIKFTQSDQMKWEVKYHSFPSGESLIGKRYIGVFNNRRFALYKVSFKTAEQPFLNKPAEWVQRTRLEIVDFFDEIEYTFAYSYALNNLYELVTSKCSEVDKLVDEILGLDLKIIEAIYGSNAGSKDVTDLLQSKILNNKLSVEVGNTLFTDPSPDVAKTLKIKYRFKGDEFDLEILEHHMLQIP